jgi:cytoskeletal protein CcmA (bactofilin family)
MDQHLTEASIEALSHSREELVSPWDREHLLECEQCQLAIEQSLGLSQEVSEALSFFQPTELEVRALVRDALLQAESAPEVLPSPRAIAGSVALSLVACALLLVGSGRAVSSVSGIVRLLDEGGVLLRALLSVGQAAPISGVLCALMACALTLLFVRPRIGLGLASLTLMCGLMNVSNAHALDRQGAWPDPAPRVNVSVENVPASQALSKAAASAGINLVLTLERDPIVSLKVKGTPLPDVIDALLGDVPGTATWTGKMLIIRTSPAAASSTEASKPATPEAEAPSANPSDLPNTPPAAQPALPVPPPPPPLPNDVTDALKKNLGQDLTKSLDLDDTIRRAVGRRISFGNTVRVERDQRAKEAVAMGGKLEVLGVVEKDAVAVGGDVHISGEVMGDVVSIGGSVQVDSTAHVHGEITSMGGSINIDPGATVDGEKHSLGAGDDDDVKGLVLGIDVDGSNDQDRDDDREDRHDDEGFLEHAMSLAASYLTVFVIGLLLISFAPDRFAAVKQVIREQPGRSVLRGLGGLLAVVVLLIALCITIIGIPVALVLGLVTFALGYVALSGAASVLGGALPIQALKQNMIAQMAVGSLVLFVVSLVPVLGGLCVAVLCLMGLGAIVQAVRAARTPGPVTLPA